MHVDVMQRIERVRATSGGRRWRQNNSESIAFVMQLTCDRFLHILQLLVGKQQVKVFKKREGENEQRFADFGHSMCCVY